MNTFLRVLTLTSSVCWLSVRCSHYAEMYIIMLRIGNYYVSIQAYSGWLPIALLLEREKYKYVKGCSMVFNSTFHMCVTFRAVRLMFSTLQNRLCAVILCLCQQHFGRFMCCMQTLIWYILFTNIKSTV